MKERHIVLVGAPNVGKSVIFNALTGGRATAANYAGTTVEYMQGSFVCGGWRYLVTDTPGLYALPPFSEDERVTAAFLRAHAADLVVYVLDAKQIRRMLPLALTLRAQGLPLVLALNMMDEARSGGVRIDVRALEKAAGLPVFPTAAAAGQGLAALRRGIAAHSGGGRAALRDGEFCGDSAAARLAGEIVASCVRRGRSRPTAAARLDAWLLQPLTGGLVLAALLYFGLYRFVGGFGAGVMVDAIQAALAAWVTPLAQSAAETIVPWAWLRLLLVGEYGVYSMGFCYAVGIVLPIVGLFFLVFSLLEDSGYLPRLALLLDRVFQAFGLNGKAVIPMVLGLGCGTMAVLVTRTLNTRRERLLSSFLLALAVPCSAQLGVMLSVLSGSGRLLTLWCAYVAGIFALSGYLADRLLPGQRGAFLMELPPLRLPLGRLILRKTWYRVVQYMREILPIFLGISCALSLLEAVGFLEALCALARPLLAFLRLPEELAQIFLLGFFRRDYGAAGLYQLCAQMALTPTQLLTAAVVLTLCMPCAAQVMMMVKERGAAAAAGIFVLTALIALLSGWLVAAAGIGG